MEIKLSAGDKIQVPANCKATIEDNQIIIEEKKEEFKDGEILIATDSSITLVFKGYHKNINAFYSYYNNRGWSNEGWNASKFRHAAEEEKQTFFDELWAKGLKWNAVTMQMERIRLRAEKGEPYLYINRIGNLMEVEDNRCPFDNENYNLGNYYLLEAQEQAEKDAKAIRAIFERRLEVK